MGRLIPCAKMVEGALLSMMTKAMQFAQELAGKSIS
jgi:hypothetical protein